MNLLHISGIVIIACLLAVGGHYMRALVHTRREARLAILEREQKFRRLAEATFEGIIVHREGLIIDVNPAFARLFGYTHAEAVGMGVGEVLNTGPTAESTPDVGISLTTVPTELRGHRQDGSTFPVEARGREYRQGDEAQVVAIRDLSEREASAKALRQSARQLRTLIDTVGGAIIQLTTDHRVVEWNHAAEQLHGQIRGQVVGLDYLETCVPEQSRQQVADTFNDVLGGERCEFEQRIVSADGTQRVVCWNLTPVHDAEGETMGILACGQDITELRASHARAVAALEAKEILLQEVYHRVKNNLQVVDSLLKRQSSGLDSEQRLPLLEAQSRIRSLAGIHELLYQTSDLQRINFRTYVKRLTADLWHSYGLTQHCVRLSLTIDDIRLGLESAIPCGLILNELITNSLKYAFPVGQGGTIVIDFHAASDGLLALSYADSGCGSNDRPTEQNRGFGLTLVHDLVYQLGGTFEQSDGTSAAVAFRFPPGPDDLTPERPT